MRSFAVLRGSGLTAGPGFERPQANEEGDLHGDIIKEIRIIGKTEHEFEEAQRRGIEEERLCEHGWHG